MFTLFNDSINYRLLSQAYFFAIAWLFLDSSRCDINHAILRVPNQFCTIIVDGRDQQGPYGSVVPSGVLEWIETEFAQNLIYCQAFGQRRAL